MPPRFWAVIPAAGNGARMGGPIPKQYLPLAGKRVIEWVLGCFLANTRISGVMVAVSPDDHLWQECMPRAPSKPVRTTTGGKERAYSVLNGMRALQTELQADDWVLVHDAVRPCLHSLDLDNLMLSLEHDPVGGILAAPLADTVKRVGDNNRIHATPDRQQLWCAFTPQMFRYSALCKALESALAAERLPTDEAAAVEALYPDQVRVIEGRSDNIKITRPADLALAAAILDSRAPGAA